MDIASRVEELLTLLDANFRDAELRERVTDELVRLGLDAVPVLLALRKREPRYRWYGAVHQALLQFGKPIVPYLLDVITREGADYSTVGLLAHFADEHHVPLLVKLMDKYSWDAHRALVRIGAPAVEPLLAKFSRADLPIKRWIIDVFSDVHDVRAIATLIECLNVPELRERAALALARIGAPVVPLMIELYLNVPERRLIAMSVLVQIGGASVQPLLDILKTVDKTLRPSIVKLLGYIGHTFAVPSLILYISDREKSVRIEAMLALGRTGDFRAVKPLLAALNDADADIRKTAGKALAWRRDEQGVNALVRAMFRFDGNRYMTAQFLGYVRDDRALEVLEWMRDAYPPLYRYDFFQRSVQVAITRIRAVPDSWFDDAPPHLSFREHYENWLANHLHNPDVRVRVDVARKLGKTGDRRAVELLKLFLKDRNKIVRRAACFSLRYLGSASSSPSQQDDDLSFSEFSDDVVMWFANSTMDQFENWRMKQLRAIAEKNSLEADEQTELATLISIYEVGRIRKAHAIQEAKRRGLAIDNQELRFDTL